MDSPCPTTLLAKDSKIDAFRQVGAKRARSTAFGFALDDVVGVDSCLQFSWTLGPAYFCLRTETVDHSHDSTMYENCR